MTKYILIMTVAILASLGVFGITIALGANPLISGFVTGSALQILYFNLLRIVERIEYE